MKSTPTRPRASEAPPPSLPRARNTRWLVLGAVGLAWLVGFGARALWLSEHTDTPGAMFQGHRLLATPDAYFYASGVQAEVNGTLGANPRVPGPGDSLLVAVASAAVRLLGASIEEVCLWLPAVLAPLVAIPLVLLGLLFGELVSGLLAALIAVLGFSYGGRSIPGYFDTDIVTVTYTLGVVALIAASFSRRRIGFGMAAALLAVIAPWVHVGSQRVVGVLVIAAFGYALVFAHRERHAMSVALLLVVAFLPLPVWVRLPLVAALGLVLSRTRVPLPSLALVTAGALVLVLSLRTGLVSGTIDVWRMLPLPGVSFPGIGDTVAEMSAAPFATLGERIAGHPVLLASGAIGYLLLCWRSRPALLLAPLLVLGTVMAASAQRHTIFAVPVVALGNAWLALVVARLALRSVRRNEAILRPLLSALLTLPALLPAFMASTGLPARIAIDTDEARLLSALARRIAPGDVLIGWWDYSYAAWYFSGASTIVDGTKQDEDLWVVAEILLTSSQREAAALARLAAERQARAPPRAPVIGDVVRAWQAESGRTPADFVPALRDGAVTLPQPTRRVFVYLPVHILSIASTIARARPAEGLVPAAELAERAFFARVPLDPSAPASSGWSYRPDEQLVLGPSGERVRVREVVDVGIDARRRRVTRSTPAHADGFVHVVNLQETQARVLMDQPAFASVLTRLLVFEDPDPALFEQVVRTRGGVVYRVLP